MTLPSRHRIRNSSPGGLRPSTLPLGHGGSPQYWLSHVDGEETLFVSFKPPRPGTEPRSLTWKAAVLTTTLELAKKIYTYVHASNGTNVTTKGKCAAFTYVARSDCGSATKTGAKTGATRDKNVIVLKCIALLIALAVALVWFGNDQILCLMKQSDVAFVCFELY